jgi:hypothetical protein
VHGVPRHRDRVRFQRHAQTLEKHPAD